MDDPGWLALFENVRVSWFRLETLQLYAADAEHAERKRFLKTGSLDRAPGTWQQMISRHTAAGRRLERVHVVREPLTDYLRYELAAYRLNAEAGETIRIVSTSAAAWPLGLPQGRDFWLLDDQQVWNMHYDVDGYFVGASEASAEEDLEQCRAWRDLAISQSVNLENYRPA